MNGSHNGTMRLARREASKMVGSFIRHLRILNSGNQLCLEGRETCTRRNESKGLEGEKCTVGSTRTYVVRVVRRTSYTGGWGGAWGPPVLRSQLVAR